MQPVPEAIARLHRLHPLIEVEFLESSSAVQLRRLRAGRLDLGVIAIGEDLPELDITGLPTERLPAGVLLVAVPKGHELAGRTRVSPAALRKERWSAGHGAPGEPQFGPWPTLAEPLITARFAVWSARLVFVAAGIGITTVPTLLKAVVPRTVITVDVDDLGMVRRSLVLVRRAPLTPAAAALREALVHGAARLAAPAPQ